MTYAMEMLTREITDMIEVLKAGGNREILADWIAHEVMQAHTDIEGVDADFHRVCTYRTVRESTRGVMSAYQKSQTENVRQEILPGFEHLQTHYVVKRARTQTMCHIDDLTYSELTAKMEEHFRLSISCKEHGEELRRFRDTKFQNIDPDSLPMAA